MNSTPVGRDKKDYFESNLRFFHPSVRPELLKFFSSPPSEVLYSYDGLPYYKSFGKHIHSSRDPLKEARLTVSRLRLSGENVLFYAPADLLYSVEALFQEREDISFDYVLLCYTDPDLLKTLLFTRDLSFLKKIKERVFVYTFGFDHEISFKKLPFDPSEIQSTLFLSNHILEKNPDIKKRSDQARGHYTDFLDKWIRDKWTLFYFERTWLLNFLKNIFFTKKQVTLFDIKKKIAQSHKNVSCVVAAAGPSLYFVIRALKETNENYTLIASDTALRPLLLAGLHPDFIICLDSGYYNALDFENLPESDSVLVADICSAPQVISRYPGPVLWVKASGEKGNLRENLTDFFLSPKEIPVLATGGSVGEASLAFAVMVGFEKIGLAGFDYSFPGYESHCVSTSHWAYYYRRADRFHPVSSQDFEIVRHRITGRQTLASGQTAPSSTSMTVISRDTAAYIKSLTSNQKVIICQLASGAFLDIGLRNTQSFLYYNTQNCKEDDFDRTLFEVSAFKGETSALVDTDVATLKNFIETLHEIEKTTFKVLQFIELKKIHEAQEASKTTENLLKTMPFLRKMFSFLETALKRRRHENKWLQKWYYFREILKVTGLIRLKSARLLKVHSSKAVL